jgi:hypothetical protein
MLRGSRNMNDMTRRFKFDVSAVDLSDSRWEKLMALADMLEVDEASGSLVIRNGKSRILLRKDGTIRIEGERIVQSASRNIALDAATIDLN